MTTIIQEINRIIKVVKSRRYGTPFVCIQAMDGPYETTIVNMVTRHIGKHGTMEGFLQAKLRRKHIPHELANQYRVLMLENMKKMVKEKA